MLKDGQTPFKCLALLIIHEIVNCPFLNSYASVKVSFLTSSKRLI